MATEPQEDVTRYYLASLHYLENALETLNRRDAAKAGELLWGSVAQALQALAASRNMRLSSHRSLRWFVAGVSKELKDRTVIDGFRHAEVLHSNFHEVDLEAEDVGEMVEPIRATVSKLIALIPPELVQES